METKIRVLVADANHDFCTLIKNLISAESDMEVVGATDDGIGLIAEGTSMQTSGFLVEIETGIHLGNCLDYIQERWGITVTTGYISYIPAPGDRMLCTMMTTSATGVSFTQFSVSPRPVK